MEKSEKWCSGIYLQADKRTLSPCEIMQNRSLPTQVPSDVNVPSILQPSVGSTKLGQEEEAGMTQMQGTSDNAYTTIKMSGSLLQANIN